MKASFRKPQTRFLLLLTVGLGFTFLINWYLQKEPQLWMLLLALGIAAVILIVHALHVILLTLFISKDPELSSKTNDRNENYEFIKGLY